MKFVLFFIIECQRLNCLLVRDQGGATGGETLTLLEDCICSNSDACRVKPKWYHFLQCFSGTLRKIVSLFHLSLLDQFLLEIKIKKSVDLNKRMLHSAVLIFFLTPTKTFVYSHDFTKDQQTVWTRWCSHSWWSVCTIPRISNPGNPDPARERGERVTWQRVPGPGGLADKHCKKDLLIHVSDAKWHHMCDTCVMAGMAEC